MGVLQVGIKTVSIGLAAGLAASAIAASATAATFDFTFLANDGSENATGVLFATDNGDGTFTATGGTINLSGVFSDSGAAALLPDPSAPTFTFSPSGFFIFDDQVLPSQNPSITNDGLLFILPNTHEVNLFSNGPSLPVPNGSYQLYDNTGEYVYGAFSAAAAVPEPAAWALMTLGFGGLGAVLRRRRTAAVAAA